MRRSILFLALVLVAGTAAAEAVIGIFTDENPGISMCFVPCAVLEPNVPIDLYIYAVLWEYATETGIVAAEFKVDNWLGDLNPGLGQVEVTYTSEVIYGDLGEDLSIAWAYPVGVGTGTVLIATIRVTMLDSSWIGPDHWMRVVEGENCDCLVVVDDCFVSHTAYGYRILLNCTEDCEWWCGYPAVGEQSWSTLKALY